MQEGLLICQTRRYISMICYLWFAMTEKEKLLNQIVTYEYVWSRVQRKLINLSGKEVENSILVFIDSWGTNRGYVWTRTLQGYKKLPFVQKILGIGSGGVADFFS